MSIHCGQHYPMLQKQAKSLKISSAKICAHVTRVLVKPTPYHALSFADVAVFARTDITSLMMRFVKRGQSETCFTFDSTYISRPIYIYWVHFYWQCMHFVTFCMYFFSSFPFPHITSISILARQIFYEIVLRATFYPILDISSFKLLCFCLIHLTKILNAF